MERWELQINVGECARQREKVVVAVQNASPGIAGVLRAMKSVGIQVGAKTLEEKMGWKHERAGLPDGSELHYFPVIAIGHGLLAAPTAVLLSDKSEIVIQAGTTALCHYHNSDPKFCTDTKNGLFELLKRLHAKSLKN